MEAHPNEAATTKDLSPTSLTLDAGVVRHIVSQVIMLTRGRALKSPELEELEACRFLLERYKPISTVTTVSKLVDLLATYGRGDGF